MIEIQEITNEDELYNQLTEEELEFNEKNRESNRKKHMYKTKANKKAKTALKGLSSKMHRVEDIGFPEQVSRMALRKKNTMKKLDRKAKR